MARKALDRQPLLTEGLVHKVVRLEQDGGDEMEILLIETGKPRQGTHGYWIERHMRFRGVDAAPSREKYDKLDAARESMASRIRLFIGSGWRTIA